MGVLFAALWIVLRRVTGDAPDAGAMLRRFGLAGAAAAGLTAFLLVPSALAILASNRLVLASKPHWAPVLSPWPHGPIWPAIVTAFFPYALGDLIHSPVLARATGAVPEMDLGYFGIVGWAAARPRSAAGLSPPARGMGCSSACSSAGSGWPSRNGRSRSSSRSSRRSGTCFPLRFYSWIALAGPRDRRARARPVHARRRGAPARGLRRARRAGPGGGSRPRGVCALPPGAPGWRRSRVPEERARRGARRARA